MNNFWWFWRIKISQKFNGIQKNLIFTPFPIFMKMWNLCNFKFAKIILFTLGQESRLNYDYVVCLLYIYALDSIWPSEFYEDFFLYKVFNFVTALDAENLAPSSVEQYFFTKSGLILDGFIRERKLTKIVWCPAQILLISTIQI